MSENEGDLISRKGVLRLIGSEESNKNYAESDPELSSYEKQVILSVTNVMRKLIEDEPVVDAQPVVHGQWTQGKWPVSAPGLDDRCWTCSACGEAQSYGECDYCPNCGAKMDLEWNE